MESITKNYIKNHLDDFTPEMVMYLSQLELIAAKDKDVAEVVLGVNGITLCIDDCHALTAKEVRDCCEQGCIVQASGGFYRPVFWKDTGDVVTVVCLDNTGSSGALAAKVFTSYQAS